MATQVQFRRGSTAQNDSFTGAVGEISINTSNDSVRVHDGSTQGGAELAKADLSNHASVGVLTATTFSGALDGNAGTATSLATARTISISSDATGSVSFDGGADADIAVTLAGSGVTAGTYGSSSAIPSITVDAKGRITSASTSSIDSTSVSNGTASVAVASDGPITSTGNHDFTAGIDVTGNITVTGTVDGRDVATDGSKLDGIEASADVTDATNVEAAGAVMESDSTTASMSFVIDEDNMSSNSATKVPTQQSVKAYVDSEVSGIVDSAPDALNTLNELAAALGDDANFSTTITTSIGTKLPLAGGTMTGNIVMSGSQTVDGRDLSVDGAKLDGIESGATADQSASEIMTAIKTVDGVGSGLDADLLDGINGGSYMRSDADDTVSAHTEWQDTYEVRLGNSADMSLHHTSGVNYIDVNQDLVIRHGSETLARFYDDNKVELYYDNSLRVETTSAGIKVTGNVNSTSDINLKKDIEIVSNPLELLSQIKGVKFTWKESEEKSAGVIAQDIEKVLPELVMGKEGDKSVNYSGLIGVLIEAIKELKAEVDELKR